VVTAPSAVLVVLVMDGAMRRCLAQGLIRHVLIEAQLVGDLGVGSDLWLDDRHVLVRHIARIRHDRLTLLQLVELLLG